MFLQVGHRDFDVEKKLRRDLKRTRALLADSQLLLAAIDSSGSSQPNGSKEQIERLHYQVRLGSRPDGSPAGPMGSSEEYSVCVQLEESEARRLEAEKVQKMLSQELENAQLELENLCKQKSLVSGNAVLRRRRRSVSR